MLAGRIDERLFQGDSTLVHVTLNAGSAVAVRRPASRSDGALLPDVGRDTLLVVHADDTIVVPKVESSK